MTTYVEPALPLAQRQAAFERELYLTRLMAPYSGRPNMRLRIAAALTRVLS